ncbi:unnamed protein product [Leuciscus chuanchicus]
MADRKRSHVRLYFSCKDSSDAVCDVCGKTVKYSGNTTNLAKHLRLSHKSEYDDIMKRRSEEEVQGEKTQDNATNMVKAMDDGNYVHIRCMAHTLHLVVTAALKECRGVTNVILIARKITGFVHRSNKAVNKLHKIQEELGLPKNTLALKTALTNLKVDADVQALLDALKMVTTLQSQLAQRFQAVFDDSSGHYFKATLLDPRFKSLPMSLLSTSEFDRLKADVAAVVDAELQFLGYLKRPVHPQLRIVESFLAEDSTESLTSDPAVTFRSKMMQPQPALAHVAMKYLTCPPNKCLL